MKEYVQLHNWNESFLKQNNYERVTSEVQQM